MEGKFKSGLHNQILEWSFLRFFDEKILKFEMECGDYF